jgi:hypothetical protein
MRQTGGFDRSGRCGDAVIPLLETEDASEQMRSALPFEAGAAVGEVRPILPAERRRIACR